MWTGITVMDSGALLCIFCVCWAEFYVFHLRTFPNLSLYCGLELQHLSVHKFVNVKVNICWKLLVVQFWCVPVMSVKGSEEAIYEHVQLSQQLRPQKCIHRVLSPPAGPQKAKAEESCAA